MKQGKVNWFDVVTTIWAVALVVAAVMWVTTPAFAGGGGPDCYAGCVWMEKCDGHGGCFSAAGNGGDCWGECGDGTSWECGYALDM